MSAVSPLTALAFCVHGSHHLKGPRRRPLTATRVSIPEFNTTSALRVVSTTSFEVSHPWFPRWPLPELRAAVEQPPGGCEWLTGVGRRRSLSDKKGNMYLVTAMKDTPTDMKQVCSPLPRGSSLPAACVVASWGLREENKTAMSWSRGCVR
jgi:hypothetical protein